MHRIKVQQVNLLNISYYELLLMMDRIYYKHGLHWIVIAIPDCLELNDHFVTNRVFRIVESMASNLEKQSEV